MSYNEKLQLATADLLITYNNLSKPWVSVSAALAAIAGALLKDFASDESAVRDFLNGVGAEASAKTLADFAEKITKLLKTNNVDRAIRLCQGVAKEFKGG